MNEITTYKNLLKARQIAKRLQQASWTIANIEKKFSFDDLHDEDYSPLLEAYLDMRGEIEGILNELNELYNETNSPNTRR